MGPLKLETAVHNDSGDVDQCNGAVQQGFVLHPCVVTTREGQGESRVGKLRSSWSFGAIM
jgi:hypothetical protein